MMNKDDQDVPSPIDLRVMADAREWESTALLKRPYRTEFFEHFSEVISTSEISAQRILELGSGPGFLAKHLLENCQIASYVALDFSQAMHDLAKERLKSHAKNIEFIERSFREPDWTKGLGTFDFVVTNQAIHELRHKKYATALHVQVKSILALGGSYLACDHYSGQDGMANSQLYMSVEDQRKALFSAGFGMVDTLLIKSGMALHLAKDWRVTK